MSDNGSGVDKQTALSLIKRTPEKGYALGNLLSRLELYYGEETARLELDSEPGCGMTVRIAVPMEERNSDGE